MASVDAIVNSVRSLYLDTKYADLVIKCHGRSFKVHHAIVCPRSRVWDKECSGGFMVLSDQTQVHDSADSSPGS